MMDTIAKQNTLEPYELSEFRLGSNRIYIDLALVYLIVFSTFSAISWNSFHSLNIASLLIFFISYIVIGWTQLSILNANHDGLHRNFGKNHSEILTAYLTAYPIGLTMAYRQVHWKHHQYFGDPEKDPDYSNYANFPKYKI